VIAPVQQSAITGEWLEEFEATAPVTGAVGPDPRSDPATAMAA